MGIYYTHLKYQLLQVIVYLVSLNKLVITCYLHLLKSLNSTVFVKYVSKYASIAMVGRSSIDP